jgi:hypothetical protein
MIQTPRCLSKAALTSHHPCREEIMQTRSKNRERTLNMLFGLLLLVGLVIIYHGAAIKGQADCLVQCFPNVGCFNESECLIFEAPCGGACPTCTDPPCTCYLYQGLCARPWVILEGVPQYQTCYRMCCDSMTWCNPGGGV